MIMYEATPRRGIVVTLRCIHYDFLVKYNTYLYLWTDESLLVFYLTLYVFKPLLLTHTPSLHICYTKRSSKSRRIC